VCSRRSFVKGRRAFAHSAATTNRRDDRSWPIPSVIGSQLLRQLYGAKLSPKQRTGLSLATWFLLTITAIPGSKTAGVMLAMALKRGA